VRCATDKRTLRIQRTVRRGGALPSKELRLPRSALEVPDEKNTDYRPAAPRTSSILVSKGSADFYVQLSIKRMDEVPQRELEYEFFSQNGGPQTRTGPIRLEKTERPDIYESRVTLFVEIRVKPGDELYLRRLGAPGTPARVVVELLAINGRRGHLNNDQCPQWCMSREFLNAPPG